MQQGNKSPSSGLTTRLQALVEKNNNNNLNKTTEIERDCAEATLHVPRGLGSPGAMGCAVPSG